MLRCFFAAVLSFCCLGDCALATQAASAPPTPALPENVAAILDDIYCLATRPRHHRSSPDAAAVPGSAARLSLGSRSALVENLVPLGRIQIRHEHAAPPRKTPRRSAVLGANLQGLSLGGNQFEAQGFRGHEYLRGNGGGAGFSLVQPPRRKPQCSQGRCSRARTFPARIQPDPTAADASFGLGLYDYYVDTLSTLARVLRFFMGIPGGSKAEGIRLMQIAIRDGQLTPVLRAFLSRRQSRKLRLPLRRSPHHNHTARRALSAKSHLSSHSRRPLRQAGQKVSRRRRLPCSRGHQRSRRRPPEENCSAGAPVARRLRPSR